MKKLLVDKDFFESINSKLVDEILNEASYRKDLIKLNFKWSEYLKFYLILTYGNNKIQQLPNEVLYTSRYYWLKMFYHYYTLCFGTEAGIEQQIGKLIEEMCNNLKDYDWSILEEISNKIEKLD